MVSSKKKLRPLDLALKGETSAHRQAARLLQKKSGKRSTKAKNRQRMSLHRSRVPIGSTSMLEPRVTRFESMSTQSQLLDADIDEFESPTPKW